MTKKKKSRVKSVIEARVVSGEFRDQQLRVVFDKPAGKILSYYDVHVFVDGTELHLVKSLKLVVEPPNLPVIVLEMLCGSEVITP